jgi:hypothetical protein
MSNDNVTDTRKAKMVAIIFVLLIGVNSASYAEKDRIELEVTRIKANQELPQILYVVPWKDVSGNEQAEQKLVLHDFFGDLYDPVLPSLSSTQSDSIQNEPRGSEPGQAVKD